MATKQPMSTMIARWHWYRV